MDARHSDAKTVIRPLASLLQSAEKTTVLIVLNQPLDKQLLKILWDKSVFTAVTDGAANRLIACVGEEKHAFIPDVITGDFDSATEDVLDFFREKSVPIIPTPDQDETDFTKCLRITVDKTRSMKVDQYVVVGCFGGRMDHLFANIATLYTAASLIPTPVYLVADGNLTCLLHPGRTVIHADTGLEDEWCGLIPIGCRCDHVTTTGLKWNLEDGTLAFGELVSTSNTYAQNTVTVDTDQPLVWTMGYRLPQLTQ